MSLMIDNNIYVGYFLRKMTYQRNILIQFIKTINQSRYFAYSHYKKNLTSSHNIKNKIYEWFDYIYYWFLQFFMKVKR